MRINKYIVLLSFLLSLMFMSCDPVDPMEIYGGTDLVNLVNAGWDDFSNQEFGSALGKFTNALNQADVLRDTSSSAILIDRTLAEIYTGLGWCNLRMLELTSAFEYFNTSQDTFQYYSFETSLGLMEVKYESAFQGSEIDNNLINESIEIGHWIFSSGMIDESDPSPFNSDPNMDSDDVKLLLIKSYYSVGILGSDIENEAGALYWIVELDPSFDYISESDPNSWNEDHFTGVGGQRYDTFEEVILAVIQELERFVA